ncbi:Similar to MTPAP: Poly(A) RNA polymerase [Cotesia congregata]|uniref:Mitochondrial (Drosophila melanogaster) n=1 Tax=Cotesia congregata TaxID=51543 RepID=A0A8J2HBI1_COTCN|nr:Similar to MTPAP: Poly(A) RNA polymerase [Cotesia congregata]
MALFIRASSNKSFLSLINKYHQKLLINSSKQIVITRKPVLTENNLTTSQNFGTLTADYNQKNDAENSQDERRNNHGAQDVESFGLFDKFLLQRKWEAKKSVIVQVKSAESYEDLYSYCQTFGPIQYIRHYSLNDVDKRPNFFLIEFQHLSSFQSFMEEATHLDINDVMPARSQILYFREEQRQKSSSLPKNEKNNTIPPLKNPTHNPNKAITNEYIKKLISVDRSVSEQMMLIYENIKLQDIDVRLRFLVANQIESSLSGLFPNSTVLPFGSSVNGFGKSDADLDLAINLRIKSGSPTSRVVFHTKEAKYDHREPMIRLLDSISGLMRTAIPGVSRVASILKARVPIVSFDHVYTGMECDLSITNSTAIYMSELLYLFGEFNDKVRPLVYTVRLWASFVGLTNSRSPGPWITNFSLTLLVLFYLQQKGILPSINYLYRHARKSDVRVADTTVDCTFLRDIKKWPPSKCLSLSLEELLFDFFCFYSEFDFASLAISLREGKIIDKPHSNHAGLYICNPLETSLMVSKNVSVTETLSLSSNVRRTASLMDGGNYYYRRGLLDIFVGKIKFERTYKNPLKVKPPAINTGPLFKTLFSSEMSNSNENYDNIDTKDRSDNGNKRNYTSNNVNQIDSGSSKNDNNNDNKFFKNQNRRQGPR